MNASLREAIRVSISALDTSTSRSKHPMDSGSFRHTLAAEKAYALTLICLLASEYQRRKPFSEIFGITSQYVLTEYPDIATIATIPIDQLATELNVPARGQLRDPLDNVKRLHHVAHASYPVPKELRPVLSVLLANALAHVLSNSSKLTTPPVSPPNLNDYLKRLQHWRLRGSALSSSPVVSVKSRIQGGLPLGASMTTNGNAGAIAPTATARLRLRNLLASGGRARIRGNSSPKIAISLRNAIRIYAFGSSR